MLNRRDAMIRLGQTGLGALTLPGLLRAEQTAATANPTRRGRAEPEVSAVGGRDGSMSGKASHAPGREALHRVRMPGFPVPGLLSQLCIPPLQLVILLLQTGHLPTERVPIPA